MAAKKTTIPNIPYCLKVLKDLIKAVPESKEQKVNYKSLKEKKVLAERAVQYLEKLHGKGAKIEIFDECNPRFKVIPI